MSVACECPKSPDFMVLRGELKEVTAQSSSVMTASGVIDDSLDTFPDQHERRKKGAASAHPGHFSVLGRLLRQLCCCWVQVRYC